MRAKIIGMLAAAVAALTPVAASAAQTIVMGTTGRGSAQQWPIFIAQQKGYFAENGIVVDLVAARGRHRHDLGKTLRGAQALHLR